MLVICLIIVAVFLIAALACFAEDRPDNGITHDQQNEKRDDEDPDPDLMAAAA